MALNCSTKVLNEVLEREGENVAKSDIKYYDSIISSAILNQIDVLEKMQERAMTAGRSDVVFEISDKIFNAVECYDKHINSDCDISKMAFDEVLYGESDPVRPPSDRLLKVAVGIYGFDNIDGLSGDSILERIRKAEIAYWKRK